MLIRPTATKITLTRPSYDFRDRRQTARVSSTTAVQSSARWPKGSASQTWGRPRTCFRILDEGVNDQSTPLRPIGRERLKLFEPTGVGAVDDIETGKTGCL